MLKIRQAAAHLRSGELEQAEALCREILAAEPGHFDALHLLGIVHAQRGDDDAAVRFISRAISLDARHVAAHSNLALSLQKLGRWDAAIASLDRALSLRPDLPEVLYNRGSALLALHRPIEALQDFERALALRPQFPQALNNCGNALRVLKRYEEAARCFRRLMSIAPDSDYVAGNLLTCLLACCDWQDVPALVAAVSDAVQRHRRAVVPFSLLAFSHSATEQLECARMHATFHYPASSSPLWPGERYVHDRIRVAYLSADFHDHATAHLAAGLFEAHDRRRFEVIGASFGPDSEDGMRDRVRRAFDRFVDVRGMSDREAASLLRDWEVDIVVDLKGFTHDCRAGILAQRAAPVQVNYLGYPGTMAAEYIDYIIADRHVIPPQHEAFYSEKVVRLPDSYQVNDRKRVIAPVTPSRADARLPESGFVFCCFNNNYKILPNLFDIWMRLLRQVPGSTLWLLADNQPAVDNLRREAVKRGVAAERLTFAQRTRADEHLARHALADLFLDTLPYNAHTTASDALWAGLPVLTCAGETFAGRVGASLLHAAGLPELVTTNLAQYEALAVELATTPTLLSDVRDRLGRNRLQCPLFDTERFTRHIESAFVTMWERIQRGERPTSFSVEPVATFSSFMG